MIPILLLVSSILALSHAASVVPIDSSSVSVKQSGPDYSYSIEENHGIAIEPSHIIQQQIPITKTAQVPGTGGNIFITQVGQKGAQHDQEQMQVQVQDQEQVQSRLSGQIHEQGIQPHQQPKAIHYFAPTVEGYQILPTNVQYALTYPYGLHHPYNLIRVI